MVEWAELAEPEGRAVDSGFAVSLDVYSGPFDVLLGMIAGNRLELTEVSLSAITEEFLEYVRGMDVARNMEAASSFIDVASILVEAKSAALLPGDEDGGRDERSMEALRERDLLFARLLAAVPRVQAGRRRLPCTSGGEFGPVPASGGDGRGHDGPAARADLDADPRGPGPSAEGR